jgi:hypothetical protein
MKKHMLASLALAALLTTGMSVVAVAQDAPNDPGHPRVNEVDQRLQNQQNRVDEGLSKGQMTPAEAAKAQNRDTKIQDKEQADMAAHNGHLTNAEQHHLNERLNNDSHTIHDDRHGSTIMKQPAGGPSAAPAAGQ